MKLWLVIRTDSPDYHEPSTVVVRAESDEDALRRVCGGPNRDPALADIRAFDEFPLQGFLRDRSNAVAVELTAEGEPGIIVSG